MNRLPVPFEEDQAPAPRHRARAERRGWTLAVWTLALILVGLVAVLLLR
jgi:cell division septal protein FtsQ